MRPVQLSSFCVAVALSMFDVTAVMASQAKVWAGSITLPTYEEGAPDPNPPFDTYATTEFNYPYTMRTSLTGERHDHTWRAVFLENEYLKCTVLPDLGGHLYTCLDKLSGQNMFYANTAIKKAEIGHRGSWAAFGLEYNFPVSHNWMSLSPVDFAWSTGADGSVAVTVGNIDRPYGMQWSVELRLKPGSTLLEEQVTLHNRSDVRHRFYWWDNAGVRVWDDSEIAYPMKFAASHYFTDIYTWPRLKPGGKDLSLVGNHTDGPVSYFSYGTREGFMGVWNPKTESGIAQYAEYAELPSRKIWSWGSDADGLGWRKALSDDDSAYVEIQAGLFRNQETYAFLRPGETIRFREYWMPVRGLGGISRADRAGVVALAVKEGKATVSLNVNAAIAGAHLTVLQGDKPRWSGTADLKPETTWTRSFDGAASGGPFAFVLADAHGTTLLKQVEGVYDTDAGGNVKLGPQTNYVAPAVESRTEDDWLRVGEDQELNGQMLLGLETYSEGLKRFPGSFALELALGRLCASMQHYSEAVPLLMKAQERDTPNATIAYYLGLAQAGLGNSRAAEMAFDIAYKQATMRAAAAMQLAELHGRDGDVQGALEYAEAAALAEPLNLKAKEQVELLLRSLGRASEADEQAAELMKLEPASDLLKVDTGKPDRRHLAADPYRVLEVATEYMELGLYRQADSVLETEYPAVPADQAEPGSVLPQAHPLVLFYAAYCRSRLGLDASPALAHAKAASVALVFPNTATDRSVLNWALSVDPHDASATYMLGTLTFSKGQYSEGMGLWAKAAALDPKLPVVAADLGKALLDVRHDPSEAQRAFQQGLGSDPTNEAIYTGLDATMSLTGASAEARASALGNYPRADVPAANMPAGLVYQLALTRAEAGEFKAANALFEGRFLPKQEGAITAEQVQLEVLLLEAEAEAKASDCKAANALLHGRLQELSANGTSAQEYVRMAHVAGHCGEVSLAKDLFQRATKQGRFADRVWVARAKQELGTPGAQETIASFRAAVPSPDAKPLLSDYTSSRWYGIGLMEQELGQPAAARQAYDNALLLPDDQMAHHFARRALGSLPPR